MKNKNKIVISLAVGLIVSALFCPPEMYAIDQGSRSIDSEVLKSFKTGQCKRHGSIIDCDYSDPSTVKKWANAMEERIKQLEIEAGKPMAVLSKVCRDKGFDDADCPKILAAMAQHESLFGKQMVGDGGRSHGFFHIMDYHKVPVTCSENLKCSATWTLNRMIAKGFASNRDNAIRLHNGSLNNPVTAKYLAIVKSKMNLF